MVQPYTSGTLQTASPSYNATLTSFGIAPPVSAMLKPVGQENILRDYPSSLLVRGALEVICPDMDQDTWLGRTCRWANRLFGYTEEQPASKVEERDIRDNAPQSSELCAYQHRFFDVNVSDLGYVAEDTAQRAYWVYGDISESPRYDIFANHHFFASHHLTVMRLKAILADPYHDSDGAFDSFEKEMSQCIARALGRINPQAQPFPVGDPDDPEYEILMNASALPPEMSNTTMACKGNAYGANDDENSCFQDRYDHGIGYYCHRKWEAHDYDRVDYYRDFNTIRAFSFGLFMIDVRFVLYQGCCHVGEFHPYPYMYVENFSRIPNSLCYDRIQNFLQAALWNSDCWDRMNVDEANPIQKMVCYPPSPSTTTTTVATTRPTTAEIESTVDKEKIVTAMLMGAWSVFTISFMACTWRSFGEPSEILKQSLSS